MDEKFEGISQNRARWGRCCEGSFNNNERFSASDILYEVQYTVLRDKLKYIVRFHISRAYCAVFCELR